MVLLDVYVCRVGNYVALHAAKHQFLICLGTAREGVPHYKDQAEPGGISSGSSTRAVFDYDLDGDLDMFLLSATPYTRTDLSPRSISGVPARLEPMYNDGGTFLDVTRSADLQHADQLWTGVVAADINLDVSRPVCGKCPHDKRYLYINLRCSHLPRARRRGADALPAHFA